MLKPTFWGNTFGDNSANCEDDFLKCEKESASSLPGAVKIAVMMNVTKGAFQHHRSNAMHLNMYSDMKQVVVRKTYTNGSRCLLERERQRQRAQHAEAKARQVRATATKWKEESLPTSRTSAFDAVAQAAELHDALHHNHEKYLLCMPWKRPTTTHTLAPFVINAS